MKKDVLDIGFTEDNDGALFLVSEHNKEDGTFISASAEKLELPQSTNNPRHPP